MIQEMLNSVQNTPLPWRAHCFHPEQQISHYITSGKQGQIPICQSRRFDLASAEDMKLIVRAVNSRDATTAALIALLGDEDMVIYQYPNEPMCRHCGAIYHVAAAPADSLGCYADCPGRMGREALKLAGG